ncbi:hypothetical protein G7077_09965 [Sphingomonas piscis]|uniref:Uncharacterized protein n=1 Tax=Sphingomonas piscis TaxID=2714943 RepID=A0A6G7YR09_9SPHN|nr:hypothetical protein [Sphingomonas piscis]QIK79173.1 hypothetical protein G7077_09965 [Sphingomonas piscis]
MRKDYYGAPSHLKTEVQSAASAQERCDRIIARYRADPVPAPAAKPALPPRRRR